MLTIIKRAFHKIREVLTNGDFWGFVHTQIFVNRVATPVEMDLSTIQPPTNNSQDTDYTFSELKLSDLLAGKWYYPISSRRYKAIQFLKNGWRCFAVTVDTTVIGDVWCAPFTNGMAQPVHPDLSMLGLHCGEGEAYAFDMLIDPLYRGKNLAVRLHRYLHSSLRNDGYRKVYGYYWNDNLPALWMHRMIKFHELPKRQVSRFFPFIHSQPLNQAKPLSDKPADSSQITSLKDKS